MYNIFNQILDQYDERSINQKIASDLPEKPTDDSNFALILKEGNKVAHKYPIDTVENVAFSFASYQKNGFKLSGEMSKVAESNLGRMLDFYGIKHDLKIDDKIKSNVVNVANKSEVKVASSTQKEYFALDNGDFQYLPLDTKEDFRLSLKEFLNNGKHLTPVLRKEAAGNFLKRASELKTVVPDSFEKYASWEVADPQTIKMAMATRYQIYNDNIKKNMDSILDKIATAEDALKAIDYIANVDKKVGVVPEKHFDLAEKFFKKANLEFQEKLSSALENKVFDEYLEPEIVDLLEEHGELAYEKLNPRLKSVILTLIK